MTETVQHSDGGEEGQTHNRVRSFVTTDAEFRQHVQRGRESGKIGPNRDFDAIDAEIGRLLEAP